MSDEACEPNTATAFHDYKILSWILMFFLCYQFQIPTVSTMIPIPQTWNPSATSTTAVPTSLSYSYFVQLNFSCKIKYNFWIVKIFFWKMFFVLSLDGNNQRSRPELSAPAATVLRRWSSWRVVLLPEANDQAPRLEYQRLSPSFGPPLPRDSGRPTAPRSAVGAKPRRHFFQLLFFLESYFL